MTDFRNCSNCGGRVETSRDGRVVACVYCGASSSVSIDPRALASGLAVDAASLRAGFDKLHEIFKATLPEHTITRETGLMFKKVSGFDVQLEELSFRLTREGSRVKAERVMTVRGITLKTETLSLEEWLTALAEKLSAMAASSGAARDAFARIAAS